MSVSRKENGSLVKKAGRAVVDLALSLTSNHAVANSAVTEAITEINNDLTEKVQLNDIPSVKLAVTSTKSYTVTKSGFVFAVANVEDNNHTIQYTRNGNNARLSLTTESIPYPVCVGDIITIQGTSSYASYICPCGCFDI